MIVSRAVRGADRRLRCRSALVLLMWLGSGRRTRGSIVGVKVTEILDYLFASMT